MLEEALYGYFFIHHRVENRWWVNLSVRVSSNDQVNCRRNNSSNWVLAIVMIQYRNVNQLHHFSKSIIWILILLLKSQIWKVRNKEPNIWLLQKAIPLRHEPICPIRNRRRGRQPLQISKNFLFHLNDLKVWISVKRSLCKCFYFRALYIIKLGSNEQRTHSNQLKLRSLNISIDREKPIDAVHSCMKAVSA